MASRIRLSTLERFEIVREAAKGVSHQTLAKRFKVTDRTIRYTITREKNALRDTSARTKTISVTLTPKELAAFEVVMGKQNIKNRSDGVRRLIQAAAGIFQADEHLEDELKGFRAALNRVGNNVTQIAKRMNEANNKGMRPSFGPASLAQIRSLAGFVLDFADQIDLLTRRKTKAINLQVSKALRELADGEE